MSSNAPPERDAEAWAEELRALRGRLVRLEERHAEMARLRDRLLESQSDQRTRARRIGERFGGMRFAASFAGLLDRTASGPPYRRAEDQVATTLRATHAEIDEVQDRIRFAQRRLRECDS